MTPADLDRLRRHADWLEDEGIGMGDHSDAPLIRKAVAEIDKLREQVGKLRAACLRVMACVKSMTRDLTFLGPQMQETGVIRDVERALQGSI